MGGRWERRGSKLDEEDGDHGVNPCSAEGRCGKKDMVDDTKTLSLSSPSSTGYIPSTPSGIENQSRPYEHDFLNKRYKERDPAFITFPSLIA